MAYDPNDPNDKKILEDAVAAAVGDVTGLKTKNQELIDREKKAKEDLQKLQEQAAGLDLPKVRELIKRLESDTEGKLIAEGKIDEVVKIRTERVVADLEKKVQEATVELQKHKESASKYLGQVRDNALRIAAGELGVRPEAMDDIVLRGGREFTVNGEGQVVSVRDGEVVLGKDGKTPLTPKEFVEDLKEKAPHLWPQASGGNASGGAATGGKKTVKDMNEAERAAFFKSNPTEYTRQAKEAGIPI